MANILRIGGAVREVTVNLTTAEMKLDEMLSHRMMGSAGKAE
jgi:hypothetical protein